MPPYLSMCDSFYLKCLLNPLMAKLIFQKFSFDIIYPVKLSQSIGIPCTLHIELEWFFFFGFPSRLWALYLISYGMYIIIISCCSVMFNSL